MIFRKHEKFCQIQIRKRSYWAIKIILLSLKMILVFEYNSSIACCNIE